MISLEENSAAAKAGVQEGDIIVGFANQPAPDIDALHRLLATLELRVAVPIEIMRGTERFVFDVSPALR